MWDVAGLLPVVACDGSPYARRLWVDSEFQAEDKTADRVTDGAISVDLNAVGITVNNGGTAGQRLFADGEIKCSLLNNAATATLSNNGGVLGQVFAKQDIVLSAGGQTLSRPTEAKDSISLISCKSPTGRYVTAHTPSIDNASGAAGGLWLKQVTGAPGYTNQPILGLQNYPDSGLAAQFPQLLSWACVAQVYRNGEFVGTATAIRGSVDVEYVSKTEQVDDRGWAHSLNGVVSSARFASQADAQAGRYTFGRPDGKGGIEFYDEFYPPPPGTQIVYINKGRDIFTYRTPVGCIVKGLPGYLQSPIMLAGSEALPGVYTGPFFLPKDGIITVVIPFENSSVSPRSQFTVTRFDGIMGSQWEPLTQEEGSYLIVTTCSDSCDPANLLDAEDGVVVTVANSGNIFGTKPKAFINAPKNVPQQTPLFHSFVVDKTPPPLWWNVFNDMTIAEASGKSWTISNSVCSDEPIGNAFSLPTHSQPEGYLGEIAAPNRWTAKHYRLSRFSPLQQQATFKESPEAQPTQVSDLQIGTQVGEYTIAAIDVVTDAAGNAAIEQPSVTFKVLQGTEGELRGRPHFEIPFEDPRSRVGGAIFGGREYPVTQIDVVFAGNVYGFTKRHFELKGFGRYLDKSVAPPQLADGEIPQLMHEFPPDSQNDNKTEMDRIAPRGITKVEQLSSTRVRLTLDSAMQSPGSRWRLFFTPDKQVFQFDDQPQDFQLEYKQTPAFRADTGRLVGETQLWQIKFADGVTWPLSWDVDQKKWKIQWGGVDYDAGDQIDSDDAFAAKLESVGFWIKSKKQVQMACRMNWIVMRQDATMPKRIDTSSALVGIGGVSSVTTEIQEPDSDGEPWRSQIGASGSMWLSKTPGEFIAGSPDSVDAFVPSVPPSATAATSEPYSYWGLDTTIHPSTPRRLRSCKAPKSHQPQGSIFHGGGEFGIHATLSLLGDSKNDGYLDLLPSGMVYGPSVSCLGPDFSWGFGAQPRPFEIGSARHLFNNINFASTGVPNKWSASISQKQAIGLVYPGINLPSSPVTKWGDVSGVVPAGRGDEADFPLLDGSTFSFGKPIDSVFVGCSGWSLAARRTCTSYRGMATATTNELLIEITGNVVVGTVCFQVPTAYSNALKSWGKTTICINGFSIPYAAKLVLSRDQEAAFMSGQSVAVASDVLSQQFRNFIGENRPILRPGDGFQYVARHVWTISKT